MVVARGSCEGDQLVREVYCDQAMDTSVEEGKSDIGTSLLKASPSKLI